jgi:AcrR family transcriptional regulator
MTETGADTKQRILDAAEGLFAERGIGATSLRAVIAAAGVNLAAVHYHFGSKEALLAAVVQRRIEPLNQQRLELLEGLEREAGDGSPVLEKLVEAFVVPPLRLCQDPQRGEMFMKLMGRLLAEPELFFQRIAGSQFAEVRERFVSAIRKALPHLTPEEIMWRLMFAIGAMAHAMRTAPWIPLASGGICRQASVEETVRRLVRFISGGLEAPMEASEK